MGAEAIYYIVLNLWTTGFVKIANGLDIPWVTPQDDGKTEEKVEPKNDSPVRVSHMVMVNITCTIITYVIDL